MKFLILLFIVLVGYLGLTLWVRDSGDGSKGKGPGFGFWTAFLILLVGLSLHYLLESLATKALLICLFPVLSFWALMFWGKKRLPRQGDWIAIVAIGISAVLSYGIYQQAISAYEQGQPFFHNVGNVEWLSFTDSATGEKTSWSPGFWIDSLTAVMVMMVSFVSFLIHVFSVGYMKGEDNYSRYFGYFGIFSFSMLLLVLTDNLFVLYCCWELVGISSFLLIGFYINKDSAAAAAKKAFVTNRVGDMGFAIGLYLIYSNLHTFSYMEVFEKIQAGEMSGRMLTLTGLFLFCGAVGKSAQFPLHIWLPDALEGPTPVSALIHAATMVAAGVFMVGRLYPIFTPDALLVVAYIGTFTALMAATIAIAQFDIKRVLAYSTLSQLGYMVAALGVGAFTAGLFHLITHAFFKALLFLCSGSVILALHHKQDMRSMGGLARKTPITFFCMTVGAIAISGVPFFSGFYSKDLILGGTLAFGMEHPQHMILFLALLAAAGITAFYMFRLIFMTFTGKPRDHHAYDRAKESPAVMWVPLVILALLAIGSGWKEKGLGGFFEERVVPWGQEIQPVEQHAAVAAYAGAAFAAEETPMENADEDAEHAAAAHDTHADVHHRAHGIAMTLSIIVAFTGIILSALTYWERIRLIDPARCARALGPLYDLVYHKYYVDEFYAKTLYKGVEVLRNALARFDLNIIDGFVNWTAKATTSTSFATGRFDNGIIDGIVNWIADVFQGLGRRVRRVETGVIQNYVLKAGSAVGLIVVLWIVVRSLTAGS